MKKNFISLIIGFILIGVGSAITVFELIDYEFINEVYLGETIKEGTKRININNMDCIKLELPKIGHQKRYNVVYDSELGAEIIVKYKYLNGIYDMKVEYDSDFNKCQDIELEYSNDNLGVRIRTIIDDIINNLKEKKIYNYGKVLYEDIEIRINPDYKEIVRIK